MIRHTRTAISPCRDIEQEPFIGAPPCHANPAVFAEVAGLPSRNVSRCKKSQVRSQIPVVANKTVAEYVALGVRSDRSVVCVQIILICTAANRGKADSMAAHIESSLLSALSSGAPEFLR
jgi:hypothetical protein